MLGDDFDPAHLTVLVLDANTITRGLSLDQLRAMGFGRALGAASTPEAWEMLLANTPDIVLIEWLGDSLDFVRKVRTSEETPNRAVSMFMLTGRGSHEDVETARRAGVDGYLRKPISGLAMGKRVRKVINNPQPFLTTSSYVGPCRRRRALANFNGPWRRIDDVAPEHAMVAGDAEELDLKAQLARAGVAALEAAARAYTPGDLAAARNIYKVVQSLVQAAEQMGDASLALGAKEMARYVQAQGATEKLNTEVVQTHIAALHQLVHLPHTLGKERDNVAQSLKRMIDKKLRPNASAA